MNEQDYQLEEEIRKFVDQINSLTQALARKLEKEVVPIAATLGEKIAGIDWEKLKAEAKEALKKGLVKARIALEEAQARLEERHPEQLSPQDERLRILQMVAEGKISPEEGAALLEALED